MLSYSEKIFHLFGQSACMDAIQKVRQQYPIPLSRGTTQAAILIPLVPSEHNSELHLVLTKRTENLAHHANQICFPGGVFENTLDQNTWQTAIRETEEELGIAQSHWKPVGSLDQWATTSGFLVTVHIGILSEPPQFRLNPQEVAKVLTIPCQHLQAREFIYAPHPQSQSHAVWQLHYEGELVWGFTGLMLQLLSRCLAQA